MKKSRVILIYLISIIILLGLTLYSAKTGSIEMTFGKLIRGLFVEYDPDVATIYDLRFPRIIIAILAGAALATSGVLLQAVMQNPLTDPGDNRHIIGGKSIGKSRNDTSPTALLFDTCLFSPRRTIGISFNIFPGMERRLKPDKANLGRRCP